MYGYEVFCSNNAVDGTLKAATIEGLSLIILDVRLVDSNGLDVCSVLKENEKTLHIPIIFLSALSTAKEKVKGLKRGAVDYISKPFDPEELLERIKIATSNFKFFNKKSCPTKAPYIDKSKKILCYREQEVALTSKEFEIIDYLFNLKNTIVKKQDLQRKVWEISQLVTEP